MPEQGSEQPGVAIDSPKFALAFIPERWSPARRLAQFLGPPFPVTSDLIKAVRAAENRRTKYFILGEVADLLRAALKEDEAELERLGFSSARNSRRYAAIAETMFLELYSSLDAIRAIVFYAYPTLQGRQNSKTEKLLRRSSERSQGKGFPEEIRVLLASAYETWFPGFRRIRVEISHGDVGTCHLDIGKNKVRYFHGNVRNGRHALIIDDIEGHIATVAGNVFDLVDGVCAFLCSQLEPRQVTAICGLYRARLYERTVSYSESVNSQSGNCSSKSWFESEPDLRCPLREHCHAYSR